MAVFLVVYILSNYVAVSLAIHLYWLCYASMERKGEYYQHPVFDPELEWWGGERDDKYMGVITWIVSAALLGWFITLWLLWAALGGDDFLDVTIDRTGNAERRKKWWKFWRWGLRHVPARLSPRHLPPKGE